MATRMIERWFPCAEVSEHSAKGWGTGFAEKSLISRSWRWRESGICAPG